MFDERETPLALRVAQLQEENRQLRLDAERLVKRVYKTLSEVLGAATNRSIDGHRLQAAIRRELQAWTVRD